MMYYFFFIKEKSVIEMFKNKLLYFSFTKIRNYKKSTSIYRGLVKDQIKNMQTHTPQ